SAGGCGGGPAGFSAWKGRTPRFEGDPGFRPVNPEAMHRLATTLKQEPNECGLSLMTAAAEGRLNAINLERVREWISQKRQRRGRPGSPNPNPEPSYFRRRRPRKYFFRLGNTLALKGAFRP